MTAIRGLALGFGRPCNVGLQQGRRRWRAAAASHTVETDVDVAENDQWRGRRLCFGCHAAPKRLSQGLSLRRNGQVMNGRR
jgi:hypothetical protein